MLQIKHLKKKQRRVIDIVFPWRRRNEAATAEKEEEEGDEQKEDEQEEKANTKLFLTHIHMPLKKFWIECSLFLDHNNPCSCININETQHCHHYVNLKNSCCRHLQHILRYWNIYFIFVNPGSLYLPTSSATCPLWPATVHHAVWPVGTPRATFPRWLFAQVWLWQPPHEVTLDTVSGGLQDWARGQNSDSASDTRCHALRRCGVWSATFPVTVGCESRRPGWFHAVVVSQVTVDGCSQFV